MTSIRDRIINSPELQPARLARNHDDLAAGLNAQGVTAIQSRFVTMRTITDECGEEADGLITALITAAAISPSVAEMLHFLRSDSGMDIGSPRAQAAVDRLVAATVFTQAQTDAFKGLALLPVVVTRAQVAAEMFNLDGTEQ